MITWVVWTWQQGPRDTSNRSVESGGRVRVLGTVQAPDYETAVAHARLQHGNSPKIKVKSRVSFELEREEVAAIERARSNPRKFYQRYR